MKIIAFANQKGGCGKTTSAHATAFGLFDTKSSVLMVDMDAQGNLSSACGFDDVEQQTLYDVIRGDCSFSNAIRSVRTGGLDLVPSDLLLSGMDAELAGDLDAPYLMREYLGTVTDDYDFAILDTSPSLGIMTTSALIAADLVVIPICPDYFSIKGLKQLQSNIEKIRNRANHDLKIAGLLLTRCDRTNLTGFIKDDLQSTAEKMGTVVFDTTIRQSVAVRESQMLQGSIFEEAPRSAVSTDYRNFISELIRKEHLCQQARTG